MNKKIIGVIVVVIVILMVVVVWNYPKNDSSSKTETNEEELIGGDQDEHGCMLMAGYSWCEAEQKCLRPWEEGCEDYILQLFNTIRQEFGEFSDSSNTELVWQVEDEEGVKEIQLEAQEISADQVVDEDFQKIKEIIEQDGFEMDKYNARGGMLGEFDSYKKDNVSLVCTLTGIYSDFNPDIKLYEPQTSDKDVKIVCAILDKSLVPEISVEKRIKEALASKHNKKVSQTQITISHQTEDHARGGVVFQPGGSENSGVFLATKVNNQWEIVFDGNGSIACEDLDEYNFPQNIVEDVCY